MASGKRVYLTMQQRLDVLKDLETSSISSIARKYNVHHSTIRRVKEKATIITQFTEKSKKEQHRKTMRKPVYKDLEQRLLTWFIERRTMGDMVSDLILLEKAAELKEEMPGCSNFKISKGWLAKFKRRNEIRLVSIHGEKASADVNGAKIFVSHFQSIIEEDDINPENIYNMDETGLLWKAVPKRTLISDSEQCVSGHKMRKERLTIGLCANAAGTHKIMPFVVHKYKKPRALRNCMDDLPVIFKAQSNAWMNQILFVDWFDKYFKKAVRTYQLENGLCGKVILLIDNCASHKFPPNYEHDEQFEVKYLPANTTSLIQPMDQGIIAKLKNSFRHRMMQRIVQYGGGLGNFYKLYSIKDCIHMIGQAWDTVTCSNIKSARKKIIPGIEVVREEEEQEDNVILEMHQILTGVSENVSVADIQQYLAECSSEEDRRRQSRELENMGNGRGEEEDDEMDVDRGEEMDEGSAEESAESEGTRERGMKWSNEAREDLSDIFNRLEGYQNHMPPSAQLFIKGLKGLILGDTDQGQ